MREILFKGFHQDENGAEKIFVNGEWISGEWVQGYYSALKAPSTGEIKHVIFSFDRAADYVIPETVGEYTGKNDRNGNRIFETDVVDCRFVGIRYPAEVIFKDGSFGVKYKYGGTDHFSPFTSYIATAEFEILGNSYSDPALLGWMKE